VAIISNAVTIADAGAFSVGLGDMILIKTITLGSAAANISFVHGTSSVVLDDTYPIYKFVFTNIHPATDNHYFLMNGSIDSGSNYNVTKTTTKFRAYHDEADSTTLLSYHSSDDLAQSTSDQRLANGLGNGNDESLSGEMFLYDPSSTTFVKHFTARILQYEAGNMADDNYTAGYFNTTSAVDGIIFKIGSGNIDAGTIKLYGIKDS